MPLEIIQSATYIQKAKNINCKININGGTITALVILVTNSDAVSKIAATRRILLKKQTTKTIEITLMKPKIQDKYFIVLAS